MAKLGFLGPEGSFCELAARKFDGQVAEYLSYQDITSLVDGVRKGTIDKAIVPIENSLEGAVNLTLDLLVEFDLKIRAEVVIPVEHNLIANQQAALTDIEHVISHPHALAQCRQFLVEELGEHQTHTADSTAGAVSELLQKGVNWAAIGTTKAAEQYHRQVIADGIQDNEANWTRFIVLAEEDSEPTGQDKTSIICSPVEDHPGALYEILQEFAVREINLTRIESRPAKKLLGDYIFFIDFVGHYEQELINEVLTAVKTKTAWCKLLGSYPRSTMMEEVLAEE